MEDVAFMDDEIDLIKLVTTNADVTNQYIVFEGVNAELFAINVAKVEELFAFVETKLLKNNHNPLIKGMMEIRTHIVPVVYFDEWYGEKAQEAQAGEILIFAHLSNRYIALVVRSVVDIVSIEPSQMQSSASINHLTNFVAKIELGAKEQLCTIFDTDRLLYDMYGEAEFLSSADVKSQKYLLFADDSLLLRKMAQSNFEKMGVKYHIYEDGEALIEALETINADEIGLFLLDLEMPKKSGLDVIEYLQTQPRFEKIPVVVHTNMANATIKESLERKKVAKLINKIDFRSIQDAISEFMR